MRVSSAIRPSLSGTLKSTRTKARLPARSTSLMESLGNAPLHQHADEVDTSARVAPLVVVPGQNLHEIAIHDFRVRRVDDTRIRIALEVHGHEFICRIGEYPLHGALGRTFERRVHGLAARLYITARREV